MIFVHKFFFTLMGWLHIYMWITGYSKGYGYGLGSEADILVFGGVVLLLLWLLAILPATVSLCKNAAEKGNPSHGCRCWPLWDCLQRGSVFWTGWMDLPSILIRAGGINLYQQTSRRIRNRGETGKSMMTGERRRVKKWRELCLQ